MISQGKVNSLTGSETFKLYKWMEANRQLMASKTVHESAILATAALGCNITPGNIGGGRNALGMVRHRGGDGSIGCIILRIIIRNIVNLVSVNLKGVCCIWGE